MEIAGENLRLAPTILDVCSRNKSIFTVILEKISSFLFDGLLFSAVLALRPMNPNLLVNSCFLSVPSGTKPIDSDVVELTVVFMRCFVVQLIVHVYEGNIVYCQREDMLADCLL